MTQHVSWIAADWGTTHLRLWGMDASNNVIETASSDKGMGALQPEEFEPALLELVNEWLPDQPATLALACGMVGARQGWIEAEYLTVPSEPLVPGRFKQAPVSDNRLDVRILPGLQQNDPADVMRGEETQIAGLLASKPSFEGVICMPGTHTKWVQIANGEIKSFKSVMTGELYALLEKQSVLKHSLEDGDLDLTEFRAAVGTTIASRSPGLPDLFSIRANDLLHGTPPASSKGRLSAMLIGAEVQAMNTLWADQQVLILGAEALAELYLLALEAAGSKAERVDAAELTLRGLISAREQLKQAEVL